MTKNYKDMPQDELRDLLGEKSSELYELAKEIDEETEFDILLFSSIGVSDGDCTSSSSSVIGSVFELAELLNNINDYHDIANVIQMWKLQKFLGIDDNKED
ncbi:TPA: DUF2482 family protein [Staphylococcus aureus]|nr:DUF2482 family protein [Staphylococcus aureus]HDF0943746.1 DUF2482 family protein [Staphylococcus aureus]